MLWEQLITDGHVRAARLRRIGTPLVTIGVIFLGIGVVRIILRPVFIPHLTAQYALNDRLSALRQAVQQNLTGLSSLSLSPKDVKSLPSANDLSAAVKSIHSSFETTGGPPPPPGVEPVSDAKAFWTGKWPPEKFVYLNRKNLWAIGTVVALPPDASYSQTDVARPVRWLAIFRKSGSGWDDIGIQGDGFIVPNGETPADPQEVPASLGTLMDLPEMSD